MKKTTTAALMMCGALSSGVGCTDMNEAGDEPGDELGQTQQAVTATTQTKQIVSSVASDEADVGGFDILGVEPLTGTIFTVHVGAKAVWSADVTTDVSWDADKVRQGQQLEVSRKVSGAPGKLGVTWTVSGKIMPFAGLVGDIDVPEIPLSVTDAACTPKFDGDADLYECVAESGSVSVIDTPMIPASPYVNMSMGVKFTINPANGVTQRSFLLGDGEVLPAAQIDLTTGVLKETAAMPCDRPAGTGLLYALDPIHYTPTSVSAVQQPRIAIGLRDPIAGAVQLPAIFDEAWGTPIHSSPNITLTGAGDAVDLGELQANNVLPKVSGLGPWAGQEGMMMAFSAQVQSACPITSYVWQFSDGTTSYGPTPQRSFAQDGQINGQLTVKDSTNMTATGSFAFSVGNMAPTANAGPDTSAMWGQAIQFQGQAVDPGALDQATLQYSWNFGDGTPGIGGASVNHAYTQPGDYVATLKVCDDHVCSEDNMNVHVRKRITSLAYTGTNAGTYSAPAQLTASLADELGKPVPGASIAFVLAGVAVGSAQTSVTGDASRSTDVTMPLGSYQIGAGFAGSSLYEASQTAEQFEVARMATSLQYTGSLSGAPNKIINLSARLVDSLGRPLAGKPVTFQLGTQQAAATTDALGNAVASLKLTQKAGQYQLVTSFAGDAAKYTAASTSSTFKLQSK